MPRDADHLIQARALLQDIRLYIQGWTKDSHPVLDYRMVDVFRGLELANRGLTALIDDTQYTELLEFHEAFQRAWRDYPISDEEIKGDG